MEIYSYQMTLISDTRNMRCSFICSACLLKFENTLYVSEKFVEQLITWVTG